MGPKNTKKYFQLTKTIIGPFLVPIFISYISYVFLEGKNPFVAGVLLAYVVFMPAIVLFLWDLSFIIHDYRKMNIDERSNFKKGAIDYGKDQWGIYGIFTILLALAYGLFYISVKILM